MKYEFSVRLTDNDGLGHVNNAVYIKYLFESIHFFAVKEMLVLHPGLKPTEIYIEYNDSIHYGDKVVVECWEVNQETNSKQNKESKEATYQRSFCFEILNNDKAVCKAKMKLALYPKAKSFYSNL